ncbi:hypothetical protein MTO96_014451 [Rhipicephalus appendiculatus]
MTRASVWEKKEEKGGDANRNSAYIATQCRRLSSPCLEFVYALTSRSGHSERYATPQACSHQVQQRPAKTFADEPGP